MFVENSVIGGIGLSQTWPSGISQYMELGKQMVSWCSWLSRQSNTLKVSGSNPGDAIRYFCSLAFLFLFLSIFDWFLSPCQRDHGFIVDIV